MSHSLALALTAGIGICLLTSQHSAAPPVHVAATAVEIALEPRTIPSAPTPPAPEPPKTVRPKVHREARPLAAMPLMAAVVTTPADSSPGQDLPTTPIVETPRPVSAPSGTIDDRYAAVLHSNIDSRTAPPKSVEYRLLKPRGEVRVNFILDRAGMMLSSELARSSGSNLLDHHALEIVREGHYPPFPSDAFPGESRHSFLITLEFHS